MDRIKGDMPISMQSGSWGDAIYFHHPEDFSSGSEFRATIIHWRRINIGDMVEKSMSSGKVALFVVDSVERAGDPKDMYHVVLKFYKYQGEPKPKSWYETIWEFILSPLDKINLC